MGKVKRHFKGNNSSDAKRQRREKEDRWRSTRGDQIERIAPVLSNIKFEAFYRAMHILEADEWEQFLETLRDPLPACFRINADYAFADSLRKQLHDFAGQKTIIDDKEVDGVVQLPWYPGGYAYKLGYDRRTIRKNDSLSGLHKWMIQHTDSGNITRQEAVSMVPPIALDVQPHHRCLDMCAAPGSKTSQLLEIVGKSLHDTEAQMGPNPPPLGVVVANDADTDRAYMLVHQCRRINSPLLVITTHQGQQFPSLDCGAAGHKSRIEYFDRVLCDVPCSGDGTMRKNPAIWSKWSTDSSVTLHPLQLSIAARGFQLLKPGGLMVYSTCSMSPYEDEAVVAELLRRFKGSIELVDGRDFIPGFKARPGLSKWAVINDFGVKLKQKRERREKKREARGALLQPDSEQIDDGSAVKVDDAGAGKEGPDGGDDDDEEEEGDEHNIINSSDPEVVACIKLGMSFFPTYADVPAFVQRKFRSTLFEPSAEEAAWMHLERCLRCLPHDEDTGGFFVATLRKIPTLETSVEEPLESAIEVNSVETLAVDGEVKEEKAGKDKVQQGGQGSRGLVDFVRWGSEQFAVLQAMYGFTANLTPDCFFIRNENTASAKSVYYVPPSVQELLRGDVDRRLKLVALGVKVFERKDGKGAAEYRLLQEGASALLPFITRRKVTVNIQDFCNLLGGGLVSFSTLSAPTVQQLSGLSSGVFVCHYAYSPEDQAPVMGNTAELPLQVFGPGPFHFYAVCWRGASRSINVMCGKLDIDRIKHQLEALRVLRPKVLSTLRKPAEKEVGAEEGGVISVGGEDEMQEPIADEEKEVVGDEEEVMET